jgi:predicted amidophosphoribosyltransferase
MNIIKQQLETLFGKLMVIEANCPVCGAKLPRVEAQPFFDGLSIYCRECNRPIRASVLLAQAGTTVTDASGVDG